MPEVAEVRHSRDALVSIALSKNVVDVLMTESGRYKSLPPVGFLDIKNDLPARIIDIETKGKFIWWTLESKNGKKWYMHCTYGMSGGWFTFATKHTAVRLKLDDGSELFFNDPRHFGTVKFLQKEKEHQKKLASLGPCILTAGMTPELFVKNVLLKPNRTIAESLMDQSCVSGIGNYLKAETLYRSKISPWRVVTDISSAEYLSLFESALSCAKLAYESKGATMLTYKTVDGSKGSAQFDFCVYSKEKCPKGHNVKNEETPEGRTSWWCDVCQT